MIKIDSKEYRNLQEQVYKNMSDIATIKAGRYVLDEFGIKVVGQEESIANMPSVATYKANNPDWEYGDAYAIGTEAPYELYILTRADGDLHAEDYWFNIGEFPMPGPQGPRGFTGATGPQGPQGNPGSNGAAAGFGTVTASATTLEPNSSATVTVSTSGLDTAKDFTFTFGIPKGEPGEDGASEWGQITGDISDQTDLVSALQGKQNVLVSGTSIKTINNESLLGSGNITVAAGEVAWSDITGKPTFATVATSGSYNDLINKPTIPVVDYPVTDVQVDGVSVLSGTVAEITMPDLTDYVTSTDLSTTLADYVESSSLGTAAYIDEDALSIAYSQITGTPTIPTDTSDLTNGAGFITSSALSGYATETWVGQQGYLTSVSWSDVSNKPTFATVATSGDYDDLLNKPTIPAAQVNSDWNAVSGVAQILNKPTIPQGISIITVSGSSGTLSADDLAKVTSNPETVIIQRSNNFYILSTNATFSGIITYVWNTTSSGIIYRRSIAITQSSGAWTFTDGNLEPVVLTGAQTVGGDKTFTGQTTFSDAVSITAATTARSIKPQSNNTYNLGTSTYNWHDLYMSGAVNRNSDSYGLVFPSTASLTANATIATTDQIIRSYNDLTDKPTIPTSATDIDGLSFVNISVRPYRPGVTTPLTSDELAAVNAAPETTWLIYTNSITNVTEIWFPQKVEPNSIYYNMVDSHGTNRTDIYCSELNRTTGTFGNENIKQFVEDVTVGGNSIVNINGVAALSSETWTFTLSDGTTTTKTIVVG